MRQSCPVRAGPGQSGCANAVTSFVKDPAAPVALRELRQHMARPVLWIALAGVSLLLAIAEPFGSGGIMGLPGRLAYWGTLSVSCYLAGAVLHLAFDAPLARRFGRWPARGLLGLLIGLATVGLVLALNLAVFDHLPQGVDGLLALVGAILPVAVVVNLLLTLLEDATATPPAQEREARAPAILARLPLARRGPLEALSAEDHYVRVRTSAGEELLLMRLADAIAETAPLPGAQVHRSHWVAWGAVTAVRRDGDRAILTLRSGAEIPVSRANLPRLRAAGLLPR